MYCDCEMRKTWNDSEHLPSKCNSESQSTSGRKKKKGKGQRGGSVIPKLPEFSTHEEKADFMINEFKVKLCTRRRRHTWSACQYAHRGETARRRDPSTYHAVPCPEMRQGNTCPRGDRCCYSHHDFEYWLHPARYCTAMCNKGAACNRVLCFFAHSPEELRTTQLSREVSFNNDPLTIADQLSDSCSSARNNFEKSGLCGEEFISSGSYNSVPEVFTPLHQRNEEWTPTMNPPVPNTLFTECSRAAILANNLPTTALPRQANASIKTENGEPVVENPYSLIDCIPSSNFSQALPQRHSSPNVMTNLSNPNLDRTQDILLKRLSANSAASHFSPTCHFSGTAQEFAKAPTPKAVTSVYPGKLESEQNSFGGYNQNQLDWMQNGLGVQGTQDCSIVNLEQLDRMKTAQMTSVTQVSDLIRGHTHQAMDYFTNQKQSPSSHVATLSPFASSSSSLFGDQSCQDLLSNVESLQLLKLQLLCNLQGGGFQSPTSSFSRSLITPQFSREEAMSGDALYSLQEEPSAVSVMPSLNPFQQSGLGIGKRF